MSAQPGSQDGTRGAALSCRAIAEADLEGIIDLFLTGFPERSRQYWSEGLGRLGGLPPVAGCPRFGYGLRAAGRWVGAILLISSPVRPGAAAAPRVNVSSWYVAPAFRVYAPLLISRATRWKQTNYLNVSPADHTRAIIEAQGFKSVSHGMFVAAPALHTRRAPARVLTSRRDWEATRAIQDHALQLLIDHQSFGCVSLWCESDRGAHPVIFRERSLRFGRIRAAQLLYAPSVEYLEGIAGTLGRFFARRRTFLMLVGASAPLRGIAGRFLPHRLPIHARGPDPQTPLDLTYTERALFDF